ncbi:hypothetical protein Ddc_13995 [Ditylenchus destructor]|nr:hypothetical protein Ddc_13995 [Ditylenchus destructor]
MTSQSNSAVNGGSHARDTAQREESASAPVQRPNRPSFSSQRTTDSVKIKAHSSMNHHAHNREPTTSSGAVSTFVRTSTSRRHQTTSTSVDEPTASASSKPAFVLNTKDLAGKQK